uniref:G-protein coupled receptors family 1 profile domain-containing protein n=1 Tax=Plectus sambesii TaxID=2011161 RepID=A0A914XFX2_9BILA
MVEINFVIGWVCNFFLLFTLPVYVLFLLTLIKYRKDKELKHAFFRLLLSNGLADILQIIMVLLGYNLAASGLVPQLFIWMGDLFVKIYFPVSRGVNVAQCVGALWIAVNRLTALHFPFSYDRIWTSKVTFIFIIAFQWFASVALTLNLVIAANTYSLRVKPDNKTIEFVVTGPFYTTPVSPAVISSFCLLMIYSFIFLAAFFKTLQRKEWTVKERAALKMTAAGFVICSALISSTIFSRFFRNDIVGAFGLTIFISSTPYSLLIFSSAVRNRFFHFVFGCFCKESSSNTSKAEVDSMAGNSIRRLPIIKNASVAPIDLKRMSYEVPNHVLTE